jgi:anti-sigma-K factor RskA
MTNGHIANDSDFELYALGALEGDERQALESHAASCAECARKLAEAQGRIALLAFAAPRIEPSPAVKERLLRAARGAASRDLRQQGPAAPEPQGATGWWTWVLAAAAAVLAAASLVLWNQNKHLDHELADMRAAMQEQQKQLDYARNVAHLIEAKDTISVALAPMPGMPQGAAHVMYNAKMGMLMYDGWIDPPPQDKSYQLWIVPMDGAPISAGVFNPVTDDSAHWMTKMPVGVAVKAFAVTLEPAGGMSQPTGPKVLAGPVS